MILKVTKGANPELWIGGKLPSNALSLHCRGKIKASPSKVNLASSVSWS